MTSLTPEQEKLEHILKLLLSDEELEADVASWLRRRAYSKQHFNERRRLGTTTGQWITKCGLEVTRVIKPTNSPSMVRRDY